MLYSDVRKSVRNVVVEIMKEFFPTTTEQNSGVIFSHTNGTEPSHPYVIINVLNIEQVGHHYTATLLDEDEKLAIEVAYEVPVQIGFCGSTAGDMAHYFTQRINNNPLAFEALRRNNLGVMRKSQIRRAPQKRETKWIDYFNQDVTFSYIGITQEEIGPIEHVVFQDDMGGPEITVPPIPEAQITTEDGNFLTTEGGDILTTEGAV